MKTKFNFILLLVIFVGIDISYAQKLPKNIIKIDQRISFENIIGKISSLSVDGKGNFIITNFRQASIKIYDNEGNFIYSYGRKGRGPGDFMYPTTTIRLLSGNLLTADFQGKLSLFNSTGDSLLKVYSVKLIPITELQQIDDNKVLLVGRNRAMKEPKLLHIFDLSKGTIVKSFFDSPFLMREPNYGRIFTTFASLASIDVKDGKIAIMLVPFPSIKIYSIDGRFIKSFDISFKNFIKIKKIDKPHLSPREFNEYFTSFSIINDIFWLADESFLIDYYRLIKFKRGATSEARYYLAKVSSNGHVIFEIKDTPKLAAVNKGYLFFNDPNLKDEVDLLKTLIIKK